MSTSEELHTAKGTREFWKEASQLKLENTGLYAENAKIKERKKQQKTFINTIKFFVLCGKGKGYEDFRTARTVDVELQKYVDQKHKHTEIFGVGDEGKYQFQKPEDALSYTLDEDTRKWEVETMRVRVSRKHFAEGGMRKCYRGGIILNNGFVSPCVFKVFFKRMKPMIMFDEVLTQVVSSSYARAWNIHLQEELAGHPKAMSKLIIVFLPVSVVQFPARKAKGKGTFATMEPYLKYTKSYEKLNDNYGRHQNSRKATIAQAFSYFTFVRSKGYLMVCDIQGVERIFTDPQIHSIDKDIFGSGNLGVKGMNQFLANFSYSKLCRKLGLPLPSVLQKQIQSSALLNESKTFLNMQTKSDDGEFDLENLEKEEDNETDFEQAKAEITQFASTMKIHDPFPEITRSKEEEPKSPRVNFEEIDLSNMSPKPVLASPKLDRNDKEYAAMFRKKAMTAFQSIMDSNKLKKKQSKDDMNLDMVDAYEVARLTRRSTMAMVDDVNVMLDTVESIEKEEAGTNANDEEI